MDRDTWRRVVWSRNQIVYHLLETEGKRSIHYFLWNGLCSSFPALFINMVMYVCVYVYICMYVCISTFYVTMCFWKTLVCFNSQFLPLLSPSSLFKDDWIDKSWHRSWLTRTKSNGNIKTKMRNNKIEFKKKGNVCLNSLKT